MKQVYDLSFLETTALVYLIVLCVILGLCMGSALNCLAWRIAHKKAGARAKAFARIAAMCCTRSTLSRCLAGFS